MTLRVPFIPPKVSPIGSEINDIKNASPVRGDGQWKSMAQACNWALGRGGQVIACGPVRPNQDEYTTVTALWHHWPRSHHLTRLWLIGLRSINSNVSPRESRHNGGTIKTDTAGTNTTKTFEFTTPQEDGAPTHIIELIEQFTTATAGTVTMIVTPTDADGPVQIDSVICVEVPRHTLDSSAGSLGVVADTCRSRASIYAPLGTAHAKQSIEGVQDQILKAETTTRRQKMFDWFNIDGYTISSTTYADVFYIDPAIQCRLISSGDTVDTVTCAVRARVSAGTGNVLFTAASGDTLTLTITTTATAVYTGTFDVETDDWTRADLIRGGTRDTVSIQARKNTSGTIVLSGISIGES